MEEKIQILAQFFNRPRYETSPAILFEMDILHKKVYNEFRVKIGFEHAITLANEAVIKKVLN